MVFIWMQTVCCKVLTLLDGPALSGCLTWHPGTHPSISPSQARNVYPDGLMVLHEPQGADFLLGLAAANSVCEYMPETYF